VGTVDVGAELQLSQKAAPAPPGAMYAPLLSTAGGLLPIDIAPWTGSASPVATQQLDWSLAPTDDHVQITDDGLAQSYFIFGGPGSGKTYMLEYLLKQIFALDASDADRKAGALILDPKAALVGEIRELLALVGREADLVVLNAGQLEAEGREVNLLDAGIDPSELGEMLVLVAQASGVGASEPFWFGSWSTLFAGALPLLAWLESERIMTMRSVMTAVLDVVGTDDRGRPVRRIQQLAAEGRDRLDELDEDHRTDMDLAIDDVEGFYRQEEDNIATVETLMRDAFSGFLRTKWKRFSYGAPNLPDVQRSTFYDAIIDEGKIVLVSVEAEDATMAKVICTLVKVLFQRSVISRLSRVRAGRLKNFERIVVLAVDEYGQVASEVPGSPVGDGSFFSLCRQNGAIGIVAAQSVNLLKTSSLKDNWPAVVSNTAAKFFMRLGDSETAEEATKLAGEADWYLTSRSTSQQKDGASMSHGTELRERKSLPASVLTQLFTKGQGAVIGSTDGKATADTVRFFQVPKWK
jgi:hypothetical protein